MQITVNSGIFGEIRRAAALKDDTKYIGERRIKYKLFEITLEGRTVYAVSASEEGYGKIRFFDSRLFAEELYGIALSGDVSPCELCEIADDLGFKKESSDKVMTIC